ncbi:RNA polymerase sigma-70 factor [Pedobacter nyackensis]|uniref:RNA polymerase sigma-70 factor n=1 Tax=Pedobacter nyackensis TaxID=475255 RepID=UPI00292D7BD3|nr:RNA polymerase sigma-70 factor [Pedobacter nyackensis]
MLTYSICSDDDLTILLQKGDLAAYAEIYDRFQALLYVYACKITRDEEDAEDIVQEVFLYLWDKRETINVNSSLSSYLYSAIRFKFFNLLDQKKVRSDYQKSLGDFIEQGTYIADYLVREKELNRLIEEEINRLPSKMQEIFRLSRKEYLSHKEIGEKLGLSEKTVKNQVNNALKILRQRLPASAFLFVFLFK